MESFLITTKVPNLVVIDYTKSGLSAIIAADFLTFVAEKIGLKKVVKLFTFANTLPDEESELNKQTDYDLLATKPLGAHERTFITLTDVKAYKEKMKLTAYRSLQLAELQKLERADYLTVLKTLKNDDWEQSTLGV